MRKLIAWVDVESTGTSAEINSLLEVAMLITDFRGKPLSNSYSSLVAVKDIPKTIAEADEVVTSIHQDSGLWRDLWNKEGKEPEVIDQELCALVDSIVTPEDVLYLGGNSPALDRRYLELYFPKLYGKLSHMTVDVTTLSLFLQEAGGISMFRKDPLHRALEDVFDSLDEYRHYVRWVTSV